MTQAQKEFFMQLLSIDSTSGRERATTLWLADHMEALCRNAVVETIEVGDGTLNLLCRWGSPRLIFCTHCDTVPPYIAPVLQSNSIEGRGTCDAKGQIMAMLMACSELEKQGLTDFGLLILSGEETGSHGAKAFAKLAERYDCVVVGEPTYNRMVKASKGTHSFHITIYGQPCHSGYPALGESAVMKFVDFCNALAAYDFPADPELGETTWNIGALRSENPQNILSPEVSFLLYFRTTFATAPIINDVVGKLLPKGSVKVNRGGDLPNRYTTLPGFKTTTVAFGSDAPHLSNFSRKIICGPGSIAVAHTAKEFISFDELDEARDIYINIAKTILAAGN